uniref:Putative secreted protein n=1 Tax=Anopheles marajoara TaxID=58244 RepID=A0A2M4C6C1_9DIPT
MMLLLWGLVFVGWEGLRSLFALACCCALSCHTTAFLTKLGVAQDHCQWCGLEMQKDAPAFGLQRWSEIQCRPVLPPATSRTSVGTCMCVCVWECVCVRVGCLCLSRSTGEVRACYCWLAMWPPRCCCYRKFTTEKANTLAKCLPPPQHPP